MSQGEFINRRLRASAVLVIFGLSVEALCLLWTRPIAFVVFFVVGGGLIGLGVVVFLFSLISAPPRNSKPPTVAG